MEYTYEFYKKSADYVLQKIGFVPEIGIILGSGLALFAEEIENSIEIPYAEIPNFLVSTAPGHAGKLICGTVSGKKVACMSGRFHSYEGYEFEQLALAPRLFKCLGCRAMIQTNAAGGVNPDYAPQDIMILRDHIKFSGDGPTRGKNIPEFGPRFYDLQTMYTPELRMLALECAKDSELRVHEGVYFFMSGPHYETPSEVRAIGLLGGDAVGMSTVAESIAAAHCGLPLLAMSVICNMAAGIQTAALSEEEVLEAGDAISRKFSDYMKRILGRI